MSKATDLAALANGIGDLAYLDTVAAADVTGLGLLAVEDSVAAADVVGLGDLAVLDTVGATEIADGAVTTAKLGTNEQRKLPRAFATFNGSNGALRDGLGMTCTRTNTGLYTITLDPAAPDTDYTVLIQGAGTTNVSSDESTSSARTASTFYIRSRNTSTNTAADADFLSIAVLW